MTDIYRYAFEGLLGVLFLVLGYFFSARLSDHRKDLDSLDERCTEVEKTMARDNTVLESLATTLRDHSTKEEVHWERISQMNERLIRIESKMPNGTLADLAKKVDRLLEKVS